MANKNAIIMPAMIDEQAYKYLKSLSAKAKTTGGKKLANAEIIRSALSAVMELELDVSGIKMEDELSQQIINAKIKKH